MRPFTWAWLLSLLALPLALGGCWNDDDDDCDPETPPVAVIMLNADAGADHDVPPGTVVLLDGTQSELTVDGVGSTEYGIRFEWTQISGPAVTLNGASSAKAWFETPAGTNSYRFRLTVENPAAEAPSSDDVDVDVTDMSPSGPFTHLTSFPINGGGEARAEISAFHPGTDRVFTTNAEDGRVDVTSIANPAAPFSDGFLDLQANAGELVVGGPNSVAIYGNWVAVAVENDDKQSPGVIQFYDATNLSFITQVDAGALPDMVTFSPNGMLCLAANEGEPDDDYGNDPEGSITVIEIPAGGPADIDPQSDVHQLDFNDFDSRIDELRQAGVRIFGPGASVSQDLEPEYIAVTADSTRAVVTCQEANAVAIVDLVNFSIEEVAPLGYKKWDFDCQPHEARITFYTFDDLPVLGTTVFGQEILLGGFSGLFYTGTDAGTGLHRFVTIPDRGPNLEPVDVDNDGVAERPFPLSDYQARVIAFTLDPVSGEVKITDQTFLTGKNGTSPITGRPNLLGTSAGLAYHDEEPVDLLGNDLSLDSYGGDFEGILVAPDGTYWMCDEYRPAIYHFAANGVLIERYVPDGSNAFGSTVGVEAFPAVYAQRRANRGFEAIAYDETTDKIYAFIQSPIDVPDAANDASSKASYIIRILEFDPNDEEATGEYVYISDKAASVDKIGDAVWAGKSGEFLVVERDSATGADSIKNVYKIELAGATNLLDDLGEGYETIAGANGTLELTDPDDLEDLGIVPVKKTLYVNLGDRGYRKYDKAEGIAILDNGMIAVANDNDFGIAGATVNTATGELTFDPTVNTQAAIALIDVYHVGLDASDRDGGANIRPWPVFGMYMPDAIAAFTVGGRQYVVTANEGDSRDYDGYSEEARVKDLDLDPIAFPDANVLLQDENLGRLKTTEAHGDLDGDGDFDRIYTFGGRSFTIWNPITGEMVYDSGDQLARRTLEIDPTRFNSEGDSSSFDGRSDDKGTEPESVTTGVIGGRPYLFVGMERFGGVLVFDIRDPRAPIYITFIDNPADVSPEGLIFVTAADSPTGMPLLISSNEASGTIAVFQLDF